MNEEAPTVRFRQGLMLTSSGAIVNLFLLAVETVVAARVLPVAIYGAWVLLTTTVQLLMIVADLGCKLSVVQFISRGDDGRTSVVVSTALMFRIATLIVMSAVVLGFRNLLQIVDPSPDLAYYVGFIPIMLATSSLDELLSAMLQGFHHYRPMALAQISRGVVRIGLTSVLLIVVHAEITGLVASWSISFALAVAYQYWSLPIRRFWDVRLATLWELLSFGSSLQATSFLTFASARLHVTVLAALAGVDSVAFFAAASRIPDALATVRDSFFRVYFPSMTSLLVQGGNKAAQLLFDRSMRLISFCGALAAVTGTVFSRQLIHIIYTSKYDSAAPAFAILMISLHMAVQVSVLGYTLTAAGRPGQSLVVTAVRTVASALGDLLLIPSLGFVGAAWAAVAGSYASFPPGALLIRSSTIQPNARLCFRQTAVLIVCAAVGWWIQPGGFFESMAFKGVIVLSFIVLSLRLSTITLDDLSLIVGGRLSRLAFRFGGARDSQGTTGPDRGMNMSRKRICLIAYKPVRRTIHALRLINYLSPLYDLTVIGHGEPDPEWPNLTWHAVPKQDRRSQLIKLGWYLLGRVSPVFYEFWYWGIARHRRAYEYAVASGADAFHAHDWEALPIAIAAARRTGGRVVFDMREYTEEEGGDRFLWRFLVGPAMHHFIRKYAAYPNVPIAGSITVCEPIAERYREELGLQPVVVFNAPRPVAVPPRSNDHDDTGDVSIRLIHHGLAQRGRGLEKLIEALVLMDRRFTLDFMLVDDSPGHLDELKELAARAAPDRVHFRDPVHPSEIVRTIAQYDLGFCVIAPASYNQLMMMPNKLFEFIQAGLAVCVGPSPAMAALVRQHGVGWVTPSFSPSDIAATLNRLTIPELRTMQQASRRAATVLNADVEMDKIVVMYRQLFSAESGPLPATTSPRGAGSSSRPIETGEQASAPRAIGGT